MTGLVIAIFGLLVTLGIFSFKESRKEIPMNISHDVISRLDKAKLDYDKAYGVLMERGVESGIALDDSIASDGTVNVVVERRIEFMNSVKTDLKRLSIASFLMSVLFSFVSFFNVQIEKIGNGYSADFMYYWLAIVMIVGIIYFGTVVYTYFIKPDRKGHQLIRFIEDKTDDFKSIWKI